MVKFPIFTIEKIFHIENELLYNNLCPGMSFSSLKINHMIFDKLI